MAIITQEQYDAVIKERDEAIRARDIALAALKEATQPSIITQFLYALGKIVGKALLGAAQRRPSLTLGVVSTLTSGILFTLSPIMSLFTFILPVVAVEGFSKLRQTLGYEAYANWKSLPIQKQKDLQDYVTAGRNAERYWEDYYETASTHPESFLPLFLSDESMAFQVGRELGRQDLHVEINPPPRPLKITLC